MAACVLHNFCLVHDDFDEGYFLDGDDDDDDEGNVDHSLLNGRVCRLAEQKRAHIANLLPQPVMTTSQKMHLYLRWPAAIFWERRCSFLY